MTACQAKVTPAGNRMLVFTTSDDTFHGHPDGLTCPPDVARRSMAMYYFTEEAAPVRKLDQLPGASRGGPRQEGRDRRRPDRASTLYDRLKRRLGISDEAAHKVLGGLAKFRKRK